MPNVKGKSREYREGLQQAVDAVVSYGTIKEASQHLGVPRQTLQKRFHEACRQHIQPSPDALRTAGLRAPRVVPMSEDERKFKEWTPHECIEELRRICAANPDRVISRNFFRVFGSISESTWNRHFGSFEEFKRQAGIKLGRHVHRHERDIAKHASRDTMRDLTEQKRAFEGSYRKPRDGRWQTALVCSDVHDRDCDPFWRRIFIETAARVQPDVVVINGDLFDLPEFSKYTQDPREWDVLGRIHWVHLFLGDIREACPDAQITLVEGNHEFRLFRHLSEATPAMRTILADLHGFNVSRLLCLDRYEVNLVARCDLAAWTERDIKEELKKNWVCLWDSVVGHHYPHGRNLGYPGWHGHHHKHVVWPGYNPTFGAYEWHQLGAGSSRSASFCEAEQWSNGFMIAHVDASKRHSAFEYVDVRDFAVVGGRFYERLDSEVVTRL